MTAVSDTLHVLKRKQTAGSTSIHSSASSLQSWAKITPLLASLIAPITSLLDIPALTQHWYSKDGVPQQDFKASIVLSAIGLAFNLIANALLVFRFSATASWWRTATQLSLYCWVVKTIIAMTNLIIFGVFSRNSPGFEYDEGFWCAVISVIGAGIISLLLLFHYIFQAGYGDDEQQKIRVSGRHFMLSIISLTSLLALQSLIFCQVEDWTYLDALYFSVVTMLTIGFGDFSPTKTVTRILLFPFAVLAIAQLANQVGMIIGFFSQRADERKTNWRKRYEDLQDSRENSRNNEHNPDGDLKKEVDFLVSQAKHEENMSEAYDLGWSLASLIVFWFVGAVIFSQLEAWPYGDGLYFCYIFFLTIGYGDFAPSSPAGRVVFIVYSLMAVPIVASFAVQTVTKILETVSKRRLTKRKEDHAGESPQDNGETYMSHADLVIRHHRKLENPRPGSLRERSPSTSTSKNADHGGNSAGKIHHDNHSDVKSKSKGDKISDIDKDETLKYTDQQLIKRTLQLAIELETQARVLLMHALPKGSQSEVLLRADMRLQSREVKNLNLEDEQTRLVPEGLVDISEPESGKIDVDDRVRRYREIFAALLATGSQLQRLEGVEQLVWERRMQREQQIIEEETEDDPEEREHLKGKHAEENQRKYGKDGAEDSV